MDIPRSGSGADAEVRFRDVPVQKRFRCRYPGQVPEVPVQGLGEVQVRFWKVPVQRFGEVPEGSGADPR